LRFVNAFPNLRLLFKVEIGNMNSNYYGRKNVLYS
jgi:hypothetical protein